MRFRKYGKSYQLVIETGEDLEDVLTLDESLWAATSIPASALQCDRKLIELLDSDGSGRITSNKLKRAIRWLLDVIADRNYLHTQEEIIPLSVITTHSPSGKALLNSALYVLKMLDRAGETGISLAQVRQFQAQATQQPLNGDGIIIPEAAEHSEIKNFIIDVITCTGGALDLSGEKGITEQNINDFMAAVISYMDWKKRGEIPEGNKATEVMPFGMDTPSICKIYKSYAGKIDSFFAMCRLMRFDPNIIRKVEEQHADFDGIAQTQADSLATYLKNAPLAHPTHKGRLPLTEESVNPFYWTWIVTLKERVLKVVLGKIGDSLSEGEWMRVQSAIAPYESYLAQKKGENVASLSMEKLTAYYHGDIHNKVMALIKADQGVAATLQGIRDLEKFLLYSKNIMRIANNCVSFPQLYSPSERALFEIGSAVIDGRWFNLAVKVDNPAQHSVMAKMSNFFMMYLEITGKTEAEKLNVAVPATAGSKGNLTVGKRGIFFTPEGKEFDARVIQIIENPISISESLASPFVRLWQFVLGKIEALSGSTEKDLQKSVDEMLHAPPPKTGQERLPSGPGLLVGLSVSAAAIGSAFAFIAKTLTGMSRMQAFFGFLGGALIVGIPVSLIAIIKLRRQDLSAILEAGGWAINVNMRPSRQQRRQFTHRLPYPENASGTPKRRWARIIVICLTIGILAVGSYYAAKVIVRRFRMKNTQSTTQIEFIFPKKSFTLRQTPRKRPG
ncbi:MAG: hypothetical protein ACMUJM_18890 [bacterium]